MRLALISTFLSIALLGGCAAMGHEGMMGGMNHDEMMRHCQAMEQGQAESDHQGAPPAVRG